MRSSNSLIDQVLAEESLRKRSKKDKALRGLAGPKLGTSFFGMLRIQMNKDVRQNAFREGPSTRRRLCGNKSGSQKLSEPSFDIAGGCYKLVLQIHSGKTFVAGAP